ncbi:MAG: helix-turn-helix transcriptional regulator [bacterium]|nr:helix-turn-helix transcriptional regulator [bacterium]
MSELCVHNRVRELRARLGLRQADLAREAGVTRQTIIAVEKGRLTPSIFVALKIARVLREPVDYVFYLEVTRPTEAAEPEVTRPTQTQAKAAAAEIAEDPAVIDEPVEDRPAVADFEVADRDGEPDDDEASDGTAAIFDFS